MSAALYFLEKLAGRLGNRDEHVSDVLRKERCPESREREDLQAVHYRGCVSITPRILHVVVNRMIVSRNGLEGRGDGKTAGTSTISKVLQARLPRTL